MGPDDPKLIEIMAQTIPIQEMIQEKDLTGKTALHYACLYGYENILNSLVKYVSKIPFKG